MLFDEVRSDKKYSEIIEYSERTASIRIRVSDLGMFPAQIEKALRNQKINSSGKFMGHKARVRFYQI